MAAIRIIWVVAAALVDTGGRVLVQRRPPGKSLAGLWEFPGGKIEGGELPEAALARELHEELGVVVEPSALYPCSFASAPIDHGHLVMLLYLCRRWSGVPVAYEATALDWCLPSELRRLSMPPADLPLIDALESALA